MQILRRGRKPMWTSRAGMLRGGVLGLGIALAACAAPAPEIAPAAAPPAAARLEPEAADALRRMSATLAGAPSFTLRFTSLREIPLPDGQPILAGGVTALTIRRPDRMVVSVGSDLGSFGLWYDGREVTILNTQQNIYGSLPLSGPLEGAVAGLEARLGVALPIAPLLAADPFAALTPAGTSGRLVGRSIIRDVVVDHYALNRPEGFWEIWLEAAPSALPLRVSFVDRAAGNARVILEFDQWNLRPRLTDQSFRFTPPPGAIRAALRPRTE